MTVNRATIDLIKRYEGAKMKAYLCPAGVPTIGYGHVVGVAMDDVRNGTTISAVEAEGLLESDLNTIEVGVRHLVTREATDNQIGAMVSLAFNIGLEAFRKSTVLRRHNAGDFNAAAQAFSLFNKATVNGKKVVLAGLVARRGAEAALYLRLPKGAIEPMPQEVVPERPLTESNIMRGGAITAGISGLTVASEAARSVADIRYSLGDWLPYIALVVALCVGAWTIYERYQMRKEGRA